MTNLSQAQANFYSSIEQINQRDWDTAAGSGNLFVSYAFLSALEKSGCVSPETGWQPYHMALRLTENSPPAFMPLYIKNHSYGEYVFDQGWAQAFEHAGGQYYPKLQSCVPFTPVTGPRFLLPENSGDPEPWFDAASATLEQFSKKMNLSSIHITFGNRQEIHRFAGRGFLLRQDQQFHWQNEGYQSFENFLDVLTSRKRKQIRKERRTALRDNNYKIIWLEGSDIQEHHWDAFFAFYLDTGARKWGQPYLNRVFFSEIGRTMRDKILLMLVVDTDNSPIAGALNFKGEDTLYGRYWGTTVDRPNLHFETCYYQAIEYAIQHRFKFVEAGAQGPHKLARGYKPVLTQSAHYITHPGLREAVERYLSVERKEIAQEATYLSEYFTPYKKQDL